MLDDHVWTDHLATQENVGKTNTGGGGCGGDDVGASPTYMTMKLFCVTCFVPKQL